MGFGVADGAIETGLACRDRVKDDHSNVDTEPWILDFSPCAAENARFGLPTGRLEVPYSNGSFVNFGGKLRYALPDNGFFATYPVSYTHLTLPTILLV